MRCRRFALLFTGLLIVATARAGNPGRYRRRSVSGNTGRAYRSAPSHARYQPGSGRPWHGHADRAGAYRGAIVSAPRSYSPLTVYAGPFGGCFYAGGSASFGFYNPMPTAGYVFAPAAVVQVPVAWPGVNVVDNTAMRRARLENDLRWHAPLQLFPIKTKPSRNTHPSTAAAKLKSRRAEVQGDAHMRNQDFHKAYERYKVAMQTAPDRPAAHFRVGFALAALRQFGSAVQYFKRGLQLDPQWPDDGESLGRIFGRQNGIAKTNVIGDATRWAKEDVRDPDRLFVLGVLLHFDNRTDKSAVLFEAAYRLAGGGDHLKAFLLAPPYSKRPVAVTPHKPKPPGGIVEIKPPVPPIPQAGGKRGAGPALPPLPKP